MLLLDFRSTTVPMPVPEFLSQGESVVSGDLQAEWKGFGHDGHDVDSYVYAVGPADALKDELYAVRIKGSPNDPTNEAFVRTARKLLSYDRKANLYVQTPDLDYDPAAGPPRPAVVRALTAAVTKNNGSGKPVPHIIPV